MAFWPNKRVVPTSILIIIILIEFSDANNLNKPRILLRSGHIVEANSDFNVTCLSNSPVKWKLPEVTHANYTTFESIHDKSNDPSYRFAETLYVYKPSFEFTGFYICHHSNWSGNDNDEETEDFDKSYIYVEDDDHLSVYEGQVVTVSVTQYQTAILPCRPTSPDVEVELSTVSGDKIAVDILMNDTKTIYHYNPFVGFITNDTLMKTTIILKCTFTKDSNKQTYVVFFSVEAVVDWIYMPRIEELTGGHTLVGEPLILRCSVETLGVTMTIDWSTPKGAPDPDAVSDLAPLAGDEDDNTRLYKNLTIDPATSADSGNYTCHVRDLQQHHSSNQITVKIFAKGEHFLDLWHENDVRAIPVQASDKEALVVVKYKGHPEPGLSWLNNRGEIIPAQANTSKYATDFNFDSASLTVKKLDIGDFGNYTLIANTSYETKMFTVFLNVSDKPQARIEDKKYLQVDVPTRIKCVASALPRPTVKWELRNCQRNACPYKTIEEASSKRRGLDIVSIVEIRANQSGTLKCTAGNSLGSDEAVHDFTVSDIASDFEMFGLPETTYLDDPRKEAIIARGETLEITCGTLLARYPDDFKWYRNDQLMTRQPGTSIRESRSNYTYKETIQIENVGMSDGGRYSCKTVSTGNQEVAHKDMTVIVKEPAPPVINSTNLNGDKKLRVYERLELFCNASGLPKPTIHWLHNGKPRQQGDSFNTKLVINRTQFSDEGEYECVISNRVATTSRKTNVIFTDKPMSYTWLIGVIAVLIFFLLFCGFCIFKKVMAERKLERELKIAGLANFVKGAIENLNPELGLDDQAELLPYDKKWEFPIEKLKLGRQLGSGAFGVVMRGEAKGIVEEEDATTVAVKMVKRNADHTYIRALASELKIMVHLGKHLNVVNLLGACTRNVAKRELLVIVEFCRFGNLQNYLLKHRDNFINQVEPKTGSVDYYIGQDILERTYSVSSNWSNPQSPTPLQYAALSFSKSNAGGMADYRGPNYDTGNDTSARTGTTTVSMSPNSEDEMTLSNNSTVQPEWRSNYQGDYKPNKVQPICTRDLLAWAFQVTRGMEYLASRKVLHGDLAARNILLADNNVVKICDFGLAKSMYKNDNYKKKGDGPLPVKWMAVESIRDRVFSTQSDVWSFGIVLWEFFSLAKSPYPGMEADERFYKKLCDGYRMESPEYAPKEVYKMMLDCWKTKPALRPTFTKLSERIGSLLEDSVRKHYIDLNDPYLMMNTQRLQDGQSDYLAMLSPPDFETISTPNYVNDLPPPGQDLAPGYLPMTPPTIFSPRLATDADGPNTVFKFDQEGQILKSKREKNCSAPGSQTEMLPMLSPNSSNAMSDSESPSPVPTITSFSNPSYHRPPVITKTEPVDNGEDGKISSDNRVEIPPDNYINMLQNKNVNKTSKENNINSYNPFGKIEKTNNINFNHYVNSESINV